jgi:hypothetical protein
MSAILLDTETVMRLIEEKRQEALAEGITPYAVVLDDAFYSVADVAALYETAEAVVHDHFLPSRHDGVLWRNERDYEKGIEAWMDFHCV